MVYLCLVLCSLIKGLLGQFTYTERPAFFRGLSQNELRYNTQTCNLETSGWSPWLPRECTKCGQSRQRYCLGAYNGCGEWYCLGRKFDYCQLSCPWIRQEDPRLDIRISGEGQCGARADFSCPECYSVRGFTSAVCLPNSTWSHPPPSCQFVICNQPNQLVNGYVDWGENCGDRITNKCYYGYELLGPSEQECDSKGLWYPPRPPICIPVKCPHLTRPQGGFLIFLSRAYRARAYFRCRMGYELHGARSIRCGARGSWTPGPPACVRSNSTLFWG